MYCTDSGTLQHLRDQVKFQVCYDDKKGNVWLKGSITLKGSDGKKKTFTRQADLTPLIVELNHRLGGAGLKISDMTSGDLTITHSGGWLSDTYHRVVSTARKIGENKIVKDIYEDVLPEVAPFVPGGTVALSLAEKAHKVLVQARQGSQTAINKIHQLKEAAQTSPQAQEVLHMMMNMNRLLKMKMGYEQDKVAGWLHNVPYRDPLTAATQKSPGQALRYLYNEGLGR